MSDWRFSPVWVAFLAASAAIALPQTAKAEGSVTNGVQVRDAMMVASAMAPDRPSDQLQPPIESKVELKVESKAETRIESKTEAVTESAAKPVNVTENVTEVAVTEVAVTESAVAPAVVAQADQNTPNTLKISPDGPNKPVN